MSSSTIVGSDASAVDDNERIADRNNTPCPTTPNKEPARGPYYSVLKEQQTSRQMSELSPVQGLPVSWNGLSVRGIGGTDDVVYHADLGTLLTPWVGMKAKKRIAKQAAERSNTEAGIANDADAMSWVQGMPKPGNKEPGLHPGERYILKDYSGLLRPGEMMLVVGRPGSGCSTALKALAGLTDAYAGTDGVVNYGSMRSDSKHFKSYRSLICFNSEEDVHDPNLTVGRTMDFATRNETVAPSARPNGAGGEALSDLEYRDKTKSDLLRAFGILHTHNTKVGDQYVRGVSGGERRRLTLAEALTTDAAVYCWDNATRGLDANTALSFTQNCRAMCDVQNKVNIVSLYQAGNAIYDLFDKVTVIAEGQVIYCGPRQEARSYFEELGFVHMEGANTADYLTAVTAMAERQVRPEMHGKVPNTASEFAAAYRHSEIAQRMRLELDNHMSNHYDNEAKTSAVLEAVDMKKNKGVSRQSPQVTTFGVQLKGALIREYQQRWGDKWSFWLRQISTFLLAWMTGSVFYDIPTTTSGLFLRGGTIFSTLIYPIIMAFADVQTAFQGRPVMAKHKAYSMYRPAAVYLAQTLADMPILIVQLIILDVIVYFLSGLQPNAGKFFTFLLFSFVLTGSITAFFRAVGYAVGNYNDATKITGGVFTAFVVYSGYVLYQPAMHPWLSWIRWLNPIYYSIEAVLSNELQGLIFECVPRQLAPFGPEYAGGPAGCAITGAAPGTTFVTGEAYLDAALQFSASHVWRNFGIVMAWWVAYVVLGCVAIERIPAAGSGKGVTLYKTGSVPSNRPTGEKHQSGAGTDLQEMDNAASSFTWKNLDYVVKADGKDLQLLDKVSGYCKAGTLTALMGSSGAGKTTLMDVLAARKDEGIISGEVLLNGHALPVSFQRTTGYCEQLDVHLPTATVREALEFSALLRQPRSYTKQQKLDYVDTIIDLLELRDLSDALVGSPGAGLGVEQRKRLTIGVELVSRPSLLFLDEPTSGLDGQSSFMILQFLKTLVSHGQSVLCTIHQPSAALFAGFDQLLLLKSGGKTVYFGAVSEMASYFQDQGVTVPSKTNPAEFMIDVVSGSASEGRDWAQVWLESHQRQDRMQELDALNKEASEGAQPLREEDHEFASPFSVQVALVCERAFVQLWRDVEYIANKFALHISVGLLVGFSYWKIGNSYADLQTRMFALFNFVFVAPGVMVQTQPKFIANRDIFEKREKKAKTYSWVVFCIGEIVAELPYLVICAALFWCCWYATAGLDLSPGAAGPVFLTMVFYEMLYTGIAQFIAAYAPNPPFAALLIPVVIAVLVTFSGVLVPYSQLTVFWKYWLYYLDPFKYLLGALVSFTTWDAEVVCTDDEYGYFDPPEGTTCGAYMSGFLQQATGYLDNPDATTDCRYCGYRNGQEYLADLNLPKQVYAWRDAMITLLFCVSSYALVFLLLKLRSKRSKVAQ